ncbi:DNA-binding transcriptional regulator, MarR family [Flexibacter flexilis DSM 6793]|uniref:DNA-binding transcriptional regulator, MarR family n=1 Tax=Flexibacter flexilis DSM 6793 TaxID=927664 RepID=A0A1I1DHA8_9BACT|nr:MarR family transcriptional regulator [Flexibacter flexilis]SFB74214.1 DNA-binding transcriptional regulator, MarR family [Flexibacter flexilis DSM 6793]
MNNEAAQNSSQDGLKLNEQICFPLYALSRSITQLYQPHLKELDLTYPQYLIMLFLWEQPQASVSELCKALLLDTGTLTPLLKRMEQKGLLTRQRDTADERKVWIRLTDEGTQLREKAKAIPPQMFCEFGMDITEFLQLREQLYKLLNKINPQSNNS